MSQLQLAFSDSESDSDSNLDAVASADHGAALSLSSSFPHALGAPAAELDRASSDSNSKKTRARKADSEYEHEEEEEEEELDEEDGSDEVQDQEQEGLYIDEEEVKDLLGDADGERHSSASATMKRRAAKKRRSPAQRKRSRVMGSDADVVKSSVDLQDVAFYETLFDDCIRNAMKTIPTNRTHLQSLAWLGRMRRSFFRELEDLPSRKQPVALDHSFRDRLALTSSRSRVQQLFGEVEAAQEVYNQRLEELERAHEELEQVMTSHTDVATTQEHLQEKLHPGLLAVGVSYCAEEN